MTASDTQFADSPMCPYHKSTRDENALQAAAESVATRHFVHASPEFCQWLDGRVSVQDEATLLAALFASPEHLLFVRARFKNLREEWQQYVCSEPDALRAEISREM